MKLLILSILLTLNIFASEKVELSKNPQFMLKSASNLAIKLGTGDSKVVYMFLDPLCKYSKSLMKKIYPNKMLQLTNTYYIFLYRLPRLDSEKMIQYIYQSEDQKSVLVDVMVDDEPVEFDDFEATKKTIDDIQAIADIAKKLDMSVRPYIISFEKGSKYCTVSEGTAACLEELEE